MDLHEPLANLTSANDAAALRVLSRTSAELTGRQVAKLAEGNAASIRNSLMRLVAVGLVQSRQEPHASYYSANRHHLLWPAIEVGLSARAHLEASLSQFVREHGEGVATAALYGSVARGDSRPDSDIDLLVVFSDSVTREIRDEFLDDFQTHTRQLTGNDVQIYDLSEIELKHLVERSDPIIASWREEAITLNGTPINKLVGVS
jgi:predicted nucleotidyltransferase